MRVVPCQLSLPILLACTSPAQQLVNDPLFQNPAAWTIVGPATQLKWNPLNIECRVSNQSSANIPVGVAQPITVPRSATYELIVHADSFVLSPNTGSMRFDCTLAGQGGTVLDSSGRVDPGPDTRMRIGHVPAGQYLLTVTGRTVWDPITSNSYWMTFTKVNLNEVTLPCPGLDQVSSQVPMFRSLELFGSFDAGAGSAIYAIAAQRLAIGLSIPGIQGQLLVDPASMVLLPSVPVTQRFSWMPWTLPMPSVYLQILETTSSPTGPVHRLGSIAYSR